MSATPEQGSEHRHNFINDGIRYLDGDWPLPGTGARRRTYYRLYFCPECMERRAEKLSYESDTYSKLQFGAEPASHAEKAVMQ